MTEAFPPATVYGPVILWERPVQLAAADFIKPGDTVFDVGGNTGGVAIAFSRMVGPQGRVLSFECNPRMIAWIRQDLESNAVNNVELVEKAAYCRADEMLSFFLDDSYYAASSSLYRDFVGRAIQVTTTTIDEVVQSRGVAPSVIKVDVEGGEADVLAGAAESIRKHRPIFILEYAADAADYLDLLWSLEYDLWDVNTYAKVDSSYRNQRYTSNVVAVPQERGRFVRDPLGPLSIHHARIAFSGEGSAQLRGWSAEGERTLQTMVHAEFGHLAHPSCAALVVPADTPIAIELEKMSGEGEIVLEGVETYRVKFEPAR